MTHGPGKLGIAWTRVIELSDPQRWSHYLGWAGGWVGNGPEAEVSGTLLVLEAVG